MSWWNKPKEKEKKSLNVGIATIQITFTDNSSEMHPIQGYYDYKGGRTFPAKYVARNFLNTMPRNDARITSKDGDKITFKDVKCAEIIKLEDHWITV